MAMAGRGSKTKPECMKAAAPLLICETPLHSGVRAAAPPGPGAARKEPDLSAERLFHCWDAAWAPERCSPHSLQH